MMEKRMLTAAERVEIARHPERPNAKTYNDFLFQDFYELHGDRLYKEDGSIIGGIALYHGSPVTVIGQVKGKNLEENMECNFGMPNPYGYRKALRLMKQAEKFNRPVITFVDTPGAYPGIEAEELGQGEAIARNLMEMSGLRVPIITVFIGEGGSGGALALAVGDRIIMLENSIFSILSPEGFATILWKDGARSEEACEKMRLTSYDLYEFGIADELVKEPVGGIKADSLGTILDLDKAIYQHLMELKKMKKGELVRARYEKYRKIGNVTARSSKQNKEQEI